MRYTVGSSSLNWLDVACRRSLRLPSRPIGGDIAIEYGKGWRLVSNSEFEEFVRQYSRPLRLIRRSARHYSFGRSLDLMLGP
jgi:hypothetical protein